MKKTFFTPPTTFRETLKGILSCTVLALALTSLAACSSDDEDDAPDNNTENPTTTLETPLYESVSAKYIITSASSDIKSIELTASGSYIITQEPVAATSINPAKGRFAKVARMVTRASAGWYDNIVEGKYTKISDTEFNLEGYGKLVITGSANDAIDLDITLLDGSKKEVKAQRTTQMDGTEKTNNLCRTWNIASVKIAFTENDYGIHFEKEYAINNLKQLSEDMKNLGRQYDDDWDEDDEEDEGDLLEDDEIPEKIIFTKSGTYVVYYQNNTLAVATWAWENAEQTSLRYSWDYESMGYDTGSWDVPYGIVSVSFRDNQLSITETSQGDPSEEESDVQITWYLNEVK